MITTFVRSILLVLKKFVILQSNGILYRGTFLKSVEKELLKLNFLSISIENFPLDKEIFYSMNLKSNREKENIVV